MSRTAVTPKLKMRWFPNEGRYWAGKLQTDLDINLVPLLLDEDKTFRGFLVLDFSSKNAVLNHYVIGLNVP